MSYQMDVLKISMSEVHLSLHKLVILNPELAKTPRFEAAVGAFSYLEKVLGDLTDYEYEDRSKIIPQRRDDGK